MARLAHPPCAPNTQGSTSDPKQIYGTSRGLPTMQLEATSGATYAAAKTNRGVRLRKMGQGETPFGEINFTPRAPKRRGAETNRRKSRKTPEVSRGCKSRRQMVGLTPLRELTRMRQGGMGEALATNLTYKQGRQSPKPN